MTLSLFAMLMAGLALLVAGAELLVRGASRLAMAVGISPLVVGLTVVAFGTSAPELSVSVQSSFAGQADLALGNVVGSNIFNVLFILGLSALVTPLVVADQLVRLDVPIMIGASVVLLLLALDGMIGRVEGGLLFAVIIGYTVFLIAQSRRPSGGGPSAPIEAPDHRPRASSWPRNVVGSNIFNILAVLGLSALVAPDGIEVARSIVTFDMLVMLAVAVACLPIFFSGHRIDRWEGAIFLGYYVAYTAYLVVHAADHPVLPAFRTGVVYFAAPLTVITLLVAGARGRGRKASH